jgi:hypothetical protein
MVEEELVEVQVVQEEELVEIVVTFRDVDLYQQ